MGIYSPNRSGAMVMEQSETNYDYSPIDLGRMMYESACNDMIVFEAVLASDFTEIRSLSEGTLLESEIKEHNKKSVKELISKLKERAKKIWEAVKGAIRNAMGKLRAYCMGDGKKFVAAYRSAMSNNHDGDFEVKAKVRDSNGVLGLIKADIEGLKKTIYNTYGGNKVNKSEIVAKHLGSLVGTDAITPREYRKKIIDEGLKEITLTKGSAEIDKMLARIENVNENIRMLNDIQKRLEGEVKKIDEALREAEKDAEKDVAANITRNITTLISAAENVVSVVATAAIDLVNTDVRNCRRALGVVVNTSKFKSKNESFVIEAAMAADAELDVALDFVPGDKVDEESDKAIDAIIADIEAEPVA